MDISREPLIVVRDAEIGRLSPFRVERFEVRASERIIVTGLSLEQTDFFIHSLIGRILPWRGELSLFGKRTSAVQTEKEWISLIEKCGLFDMRVPLLEEYSVEANLMLSSVFDLREDIREETRERVLSRAFRFGVKESELNQPLFQSEYGLRVRIQFFRALIYEPQILFINALTIDDDMKSEEKYIARYCAKLEWRPAQIIFTRHRQFYRKIADKVYSYDSESGLLIRKL